jgi:hypothetical protein
MPTKTWHGTHQKNGPRFRCHPPQAALFQASSKHLFHRTCMVASGTIKRDRWGISISTRPDFIFIQKNIFTCRLLPYFWTMCRPALARLDETFPHVYSITSPSVVK